VAYETRRGTLDELAAHYEAAGAPKGEIVIVVAPPDPDANRISPDELDSRLQRALKRGSLKDAVAEVSDETGMKKREVYARALALADGEKRR
jgi:16S rRNA (cytidine1402-2'-O)-methyltransferase